MDFSKIIHSPLFAFAVSVVVFFGVSALYFSPQFEGKVLRQNDVIQYEGMTRDIKQMRAETGEDPQWTGGMFGGMPAYMINIAYPAQAVKGTVGQMTKIIDTPAGFLFFAMTAMWLMLLIFGVNPWIGTIAALAYGLSTYFVLIIGAGHITKMWALVYAPLMMGGAWMTLRRNMWYGAALTALVTSLEIGANHPQITYYFLMAMAAMWLSEGVIAFKHKTLKDFAKRTAVLAAAGIVAVGSNFAPLWYTAQHTKDTIRGGSELAQTTTHEASDNGLDLQYATAWSYGKAESFNMLVPDLMGAAPLPSDGETARLMRECQNPGLERYLPSYWGDQPFTAGPTYLGASVIVLALMGLILLKGRERWWILAISVVMLLLAWGYHFMAFTELMFDFLPGYNKFRTVSMTLVVVQWTVPLLAALVLTRLWKREDDPQKMRRGVGIATAVVGGLCLIFALLGAKIFDFGFNATYDYISSSLTRDVELATAITEAMVADRAAMLQSDAWRSLLFVVLSGGAAYLYTLKNIRRWIPTLLLGVLVVWDLAGVDRRFLSADDFVAPRTTQVVPSAADREIMEDKDPGYRVLNLAVGNPFSDATTSYFHRSVGGYHGAKLARYQDLIDRYLAPHVMNMEVYAMLNTRYVIVPDEAGNPRVEPMSAPNGAAWFVEEAAYAATPNEEISMLGEVDTKRTAVLSAKDKVEKFTTGEIRLTRYQPNHLLYEYTAAEDGLAVFSEIYYAKGWTAYIDGAEAPYLRADYVLRAMELPAGRHTVEWKFRAPAWDTIEAVTWVLSLVVLSGAAAAAFFALRKAWHAHKN